ncbi:alkylated DNA repair protein alkB 8-like isoform X5 [Dinothrombium tinctorium]|uniref:Alkylated DNA repair protein alkB 8-like isoform X5 n=1 Tax=Dinothrombium tinctorium TaxID=1965070 RepID=A0A3S3PZ89_9ACAR|nr:alkylated DNA repair protein alkB 8-like isoform X5 [Dinothrombium tinctorium]
MQSEIDGNETASLDLEKEHVFDVYEKIAADFSETRYKPWPKVKHFLDSLDCGSIVYDIGCGNGKYLDLNANIATIGCDTSFALLQICANKALETFAANVLCLPLKRDSADACICIAVIHHLSTEARRVKAIEEILATLKVGGKALIYVWAFEQRKDGKASKYIKSGKN